MDTFISDLSEKTFPLRERVSANGIQLPILRIIQNDHPSFKGECYCGLSELNTYRQKYIADYLTKEVGELSALESMVLEALANKDIVTEKFNEKNQSLTLGQRAAYRIATFGGSWKFITFFFLFLSGWIVVNAYLLGQPSFDPYPFILLNLILSCLASLQAPLIMMSQNRQDEKDRERSKQDYVINLKAELEIRMLHEKLDHMMIHQQQELIKIQEVQIQMMRDIMEKVTAEVLLSNKPE